MKRIYAYIIIIICALGLLLYTADEAEVKSEDAAQQNDMVKDTEKTLSSLKKINDSSLYTMTYYGDYGFKEYLEVGKTIAVYDDSLSKDVACSCFAALSEEKDMIFGRNFDWYSNPKLILYTDSPDGYASVSMVDMKYMNFNSDQDIADASESDLKRLLDAPYLPFDGMNEYGLSMGEMTAMGTETAIDPDKVTLGDLTVIRLALDYAKTVEEAIALIGKYNVYFPPAPPLHFLVADSKGNSAIIEFVKGEMKVLKNEEKWQVATNFIVHGSSEETKNGCRRYIKAEKVLREKNGSLTEEEAMTLLEEISQYTTQWSVVYNMSTGNIGLAVGREYDAILNFHLPLKS